MCKKGRRLHKKRESEMKKKNESLFLIEKNERIKIRMIDHINKTQNIEYGSSKVFDSLTRVDWSIDKWLGKSTSFMKWKNICGENQKMRSSVTLIGLDDV